MSSSLRYRGDNHLEENDEAYSRLSSTSKLDLIEPNQLNRSVPQAHLVSRETVSEADEEILTAPVDLSTIVHLPRPIGSSPERCYGRLVHLSLRKPLSWSMGDFEVFDVGTKEAVFVCKGKVNLKNEKEILDPSGNPLFHLSTKTWSLSRKTLITYPNGQPACEIALKSWVVHPKFVARFKDHITGQQTELLLDGTIKRGRATILFDNQVIALVYREKLIKQDERRIVIAPNADIGLVFAAVVVFDMVLTEWIASSSILAPLLTATSY